MNAKTGGQAFPRTRPDGGMCSSLDVEGMTLLDYFAGQALNGIISTGYEPPASTPLSIFPKVAYDYAEAMIAEKKRRES